MKAGERWSTRASCSVVSPEQQRSREAHPPFVPTQFTVYNRPYHITFPIVTSRAVAVQNWIATAAKSPVLSFLSFPSSLICQDVLVRTRGVYYHVTLALRNGDIDMREREFRSLERPTRRARRHGEDHDPLRLRRRAHDDDADPRVPSSKGARALSGVKFGSRPPAALRCFPVIFHSPLLIVRVAIALRDDGARSLAFVSERVECVIDGWSYPQCLPFFVSLARFTLSFLAFARARIAGSSRCAPLSTPLDPPRRTRARCGHGVTDYGIELFELCKLSCCLLLTRGRYRRSLSSFLRGLLKLYVAAASTAQRIFQIV